MTKLDQLLNEKEIFLKFMREKYKFIYNSNVFLRDIQFAITNYFEKKDQKITYKEAEDLMYSFTELLEKENEIVKLSNNTWKVNYKFNDPVEVEKEEETVAEEINN